MSRPVVALLTDFGTRDHYVGAMKGVILGICPEVTLVDLSHHIPPHDILAGALELDAGYPYFPAGTIFLAVVDPGVGSARRALGVEAGEYRFVAPDNGLLTPVLHATMPTQVVELAEGQYARSTVSRTFEGRDRFAPAAGWMARGVHVAAFGPAVTDYVLLDIPRAACSEHGILGEVVRVDRFGNLVTNVTRVEVERFARQATVVVSAGGRPVRRLVTTYGDLEAGGVGALFGSADVLEIVVNGGSACLQLGLDKGTPVSIRRV